MFFRHVLLTCIEVKVKGQGQSLRSKSNVPRCICLSSQFFTGVQWSIMVLGLSSTAKSPMKQNSRVSISLGVQIGCVLISVVVSTGWAFAVDHTFNFNFARSSFIIGLHNSVTTVWNDYSLLLVSFGNPYRLF